jgi:hypothetical protein
MGQQADTSSLLARPVLRIRYGKFQLSGFGSP